MKSAKFIISKISRETERIVISYTMWKSRTQLFMNSYTKDSPLHGLTDKNFQVKLNDDLASISYWLLIIAMLYKFKTFKRNNLTCCLLHTYVTIWCDGFVI